MTSPIFSSGYTAAETKIQESSVLLNVSKSHLDALEEINLRTSRTFAYLAVPVHTGHVCKSFSRKTVSDRSELSTVQTPTSQRNMCFSPLLTSWRSGKLLISITGEAQAVVLFLSGQNEAFHFLVWVKS